MKRTLFRIAGNPAGIRTQRLLNTYQQRRCYINFPGYCELKSVQIRKACSTIADKSVHASQVGNFIEVTSWAWALWDEIIIMDAGN
jgi:hypothetical protein